jgi:hypothetical protein
MATKLAGMASSSQDYQWLGLSRTSIEPWEDGARTDDSAGTYEWWYVDAHLADGAKLVLVFANKDITVPKQPLSPQLRLNLDLADGRYFEKIVSYPAGEWSSAEDHCDVRMGRGRDFLDVGTYFTFTFTASGAPLSPDGTVGIKGSLRMKDQSHLIEFVATLATPSVGSITVGRAPMGAGFANRGVTVAQFVQ